MAFNPLKEKGMPIEKQLESWSELNVKPYNKKEVHPYTRCRGILMNGIEVEGALFSHQFARHTADMELKKKLAMVRRVEQQQQKMVNWMIPADESTLEVTIGYEQVAVDLTAFLARTCQDSYVKSVMDFGLLEDFDHLYRYANLLEMTEGKDAQSIIGDYTEVIPGRPTAKEHRHPFDDVRNAARNGKRDIKTQLYVLTLLAGEQQTMNYYMNVGNRIADHTGRGLYLEIGQIEEQHVTQYESLLDPTASWFEMLLLHEYNECYLYHSFMEQEPDPVAKKHWQEHLEMEITHLQMASDLLKQYEKKDAADMLPASLPEPVVFESNIDYVRQILNTQTDLTADGPEFVPVNKLPKDHRYFQYQKMVNGDWIPSEAVIEANKKKSGKDYRLELAHA